MTLEKSVFGARTWVLLNNVSSAMQTRYNIGNLYRAYVTEVTCISYKAEEWQTVSGVHFANIFSKKLNKVFPFYFNVVFLV